MGKTLPKLSFEDTERAFNYKSNAELKRTYRLFRMIDSPFLTRIGPPLVTFSLKIGLPVKGIIKNTIFDIFCGGTSIENTATRSRQLFKKGVQTILDYSVEGEKNETGFNETCAEIIRTLEYGAGKEEVAFSAMKVTGIADFDFLADQQAGKKLGKNEELGLKNGKERLEKICLKALELKQPVFIDAEETWIQDVIDTWAEEMMERCNKELPLVYTTVQLYRHDRLEYLKELIERAKEKGYILGVKLVRGAYLEKETDRAKEMHYPNPMQPNKKSTDKDFNAALELCVENIGHVAICAGTHNERSSLYLTELMQKAGIPNAHLHILFAQLLGMSDHISFNLGFHGYRVAKYLPYGPVKAVMPYLIRRAQENTSVGGQASREVELLKREVKRRGI